MYTEVRSAHIQDAKRSIEDTACVVIAEWAEQAGTTRLEREETKAWLSRRIDVARAADGRNAYEESLPL